MHHLTHCRLSTWLRRGAEATILRGDGVERGSTDCIAERVTTIFGHVLGRSDLAVSASISGLQIPRSSLPELSTRLTEETGVPVAPLSIVVAQTIGDIAASIAEHLASTASGDRNGACREPSAGNQALEQSGAFSASFAQEDLWLVDQIDSGGVAYNVSIVLYAPKGLDERAARQAIDLIAERHEPLRSYFRFSDGGLSQVTIDDFGPDYEVVDAGSAAAAAVEIAPRVLQLFNAYAAQHFDLGSGPLFRSRQYRLPGDAVAFQFVAHHSVFDGWSKQIFIREFCTFYGEISNQKNPSATNLSRGYRDFAVSQRINFESTKFDDVKRFWVEALKDAQPLLDLPTDRSRPPVKSYAGRRIVNELPAPLAEAARAVAREHGASLFMVLIAGFYVLLYRYSRQSDIVVGVPTANRKDPAFEHVIGHFVNTIALRANVDGTETFTSFLRQIRSHVLEAQENGEYPFAKVVEAVNPPRSLSYSPLFQVLFEFHTENRLAEDLETVGFQEVCHDPGTAKYDLCLELTAARGAISITAEYSSDLYDRTTVERMLGHYRRILEEVCKQPAAAIDDIDLLGEGEVDELALFELAETQESSDLTIADCFFQRCAQQPDAVALVDSSTTFTYREIEERVRAFSKELAVRGIGCGDRVAIVLDRSAEMVIAILGVLVRGGCYVPMDPDFPVDRLRFILCDSGASLILTQLRYRDVLGADLNAPIEVIESLVGHHAPPVESADRVQADAAAYIIYTSGSTGSPKGVVVSHRSVMNTLAFLQDKYPVKPADSYLLKTNYTFDVSVSELFGWFVGQGSLVVLPIGLERDPEALCSFIPQHRITHVNFSPTMLRPFVVQAAEDQSFKRASALKYVIVAGEAFPRDLVQTAINALAPARVENLYGPTEASIYSTWYSCQPTVDSVNTPIGRPISNTRAYVLDPHRRRLPVGIPGELYLGGAGIAIGYLNRPDLNADRFVANPFDPGDRLYRTGDVVRWLDNGQIEYLGRTDFQVKIRGMRVELGEIEASILHSGFVNDAVVLAVDAEQTSKRLVAFVVPAQEYASTDHSADGEQPGYQQDLSNALREFLQRSLPRYMVPALVVKLDMLPLTSSGKINRQALISAIPTRSPISPTSAPAVDENECLIRGSWCKILGVEDVGVTDNFFSIGGDSILAIQMVADLRKIGLHLTSRQVFEHQTIRRLAAVASSSIYLHDQARSSGEFDLLPIQRHFFSLDPHHIDHYHQSQIYVIPGGVSYDFVCSWVAALQERHDCFRLQFTEANGTWSAHFLDRKYAPDSIVDIVHLPAAFDQSESQQLLLEAESGARSGIDVRSGCLARFVLIQSAAGDESHILAVLHHLIVDGVSWRIMLDDLRDALEQWQNKPQIVLGTKTAAYQSWARALHSNAASTRLLAQADYWASIVSDPTGGLPADRPVEGAGTRATTEIATLRLTAQETETLLGTANRTYRTQVNELLLAGLALALGRWASISRFRLAIEGHGRESAAVMDWAGTHDELDLTGTIGWFTTWYPVALELPANHDTLDRHSLLKATIISVKEAYRNIPDHGLGFGVLRYISADSRIQTGLADRPIQLVFNYLGRFEDGDGEGFRAAHIASKWKGNDVSPDRARDHKLGINGKVSSGCLEFEVDFNTQEYDRHTISALADDFTTALREIAEHCAAEATVWLTPSDFPLVVVSQHELDEWADQLHGISRLYPASGMQIGMMFHSLMPGAEESYTNQIVLTLGAGFDSGAFRRAWHQLIERHDALRTAFVGLDRRDPLQIVVEEFEVPWRDVTLRAAASSLDLTKEIDDILDRERSEPFDFGRPPLARLTLISSGAQHCCFALTYHHSLLDGWSTAILWGELLSLYRSALTGTVPALDPPHAPSALAKWRLNHTDHDDRRFWKQELQGYQGVPRKGNVSRPTYSKKSGHARPSRHFSLDARRSEEIRLVAREYNVTLSTVIQAAWAYALASHSGRRDIVFGMILSGRSVDLADVDRIVGLAIKTIPVREFLPDAPNWREYLRYLHQRHAEREAHSALDLIEIQRLSQISNSNDLFDCVLIIENYPSSTARLAPEIGINGYRWIEATHYGITGIVQDTDLISFTIDVGSEAIDEKEVAVMEKSIKATLDGIVRSHAGSPTKDSVVVSSDKMRPSTVHRQGELRLGRYLVHELVENAALTNPGKIAVICNDAVLTYDEVNRLANRIANGLLAQFSDLRPDSVVGVHLPRDEKLLITILGLWKAGLAYMPLDPTLPASRLKELVKESNASLIIAGDDEGDSGWPVRRIAYSMLSSERQGADENPSQNVSANDLAYVIFTSGSTGTPKGAMIEHIGMLNNIVNKAHDFEVTAASRVAQNASQSFDVCIWQMFIALCHEATTVIYDDKTVLNILGFMERIQSDQITILETVPTYFVLMVEYAEAHKRTARFADLAYMIVNGETADARFINRWFACWPSTKIVNAYGPTEASDDVTHHIMASTDVVENPVPIGRTLANFDLYIVDETMSPVPIGERGEIVVTGIGVGRGYINTPPDSASAFVASPFPDKYRGRLYRTGDLGEMRSDGLVFFHGRRDKQVKIRGLRIELEEIEIALKQLPTVKQAVVLDAKSTAGDGYLAAFIVVEPGGAIDDIIARLREQLPAYMVPTVVRTVERLPELINGKVDRGQLRVALASDSQDREVAPPVSPIEQRLHKIWVEVLDRSDVGVSEDFFALGGDSFKAIRIAAKYGPGLEVADIYDHVTIAAIAAHIQDRGAEHASKLLVPISGDVAHSRYAVVGISNSGGDPVNFFSVGRALEAAAAPVALYAVKLPRHEVRSSEEMSLEIERLTAEICAEIEQELTVPVLLYAQCNGSALGVSIARALEQRGVNLRGLFVGNAMPRNALSADDSRSDSEILSWLASIDSTLPQRSDEIAFFLRDFRYDCFMADTYFNRLYQEVASGNSTKLNAPLVCVVGTKDPTLGDYEARSRGWEPTASCVKIYECDGDGHYLLRDCPEKVAKGIVEFVGKVLHSGGGH